MALCQDHSADHSCVGAVEDVTSSAGQVVGEDEINTITCISTGCRVTSADPSFDHVLLMCKEHAKELDDCSRQDAIGYSGETGDLQSEKAEHNTDKAEDNTDDGVSVSTGSKISSATALGVTNDTESFSVQTAFKKDLMHYKEACLDMMKDLGE